MQPDGAPRHALFVLTGRWPPAPNSFSEGAKLCRTPLLIDTSKYAIYVKVLAGQGDGPLVTIDANGHIHVGGGDPGPLRDKLQAAPPSRSRPASPAFGSAMAGQKQAAA